MISDKEKKVNLFYCQITKWTGYFLGLLATFIIVVNRNAEGVKLFPLIQIYMNASQVECKSKKLS